VGWHPPGCCLGTAHASIACQQRPLPISLHADSRGPCFSLRLPLADEFTDDEPVVGSGDEEAEEEDGAGAPEQKRSPRRKRAAEGREEEEEEEEEEKGDEESDDDEDEDDDDDAIASSSDDEKDDDERQPHNAKGFLEGGKVDSFSRAFNRLIGNVDGSSKAPILAGSKSVHRRKEEEKLELEASKAAKKLHDEMKKRGHYLPSKKGIDPQRDTLEKRLLKTATKGVVQLFNAISTAQKRIRSEETSGNKAKAAKLGKAGFLAGIRQVRERQEREAKAAGGQRAGDDDGVDGERAAGWDVLRDGFVGINDESVRMRDWDSKGGGDDDGSGGDDDDDDGSGDDDGF